MNSSYHELNLKIQKCQEAFNLNYVLVNSPDCITEKKINIAFLTKNSISSKNSGLFQALKGTSPG